MTSQFDALGLSPALVETLNELGYTEPTPIQTQMIPVMLAGRDVIGQAQTGTGKTAAFALPILQQLDRELGHVQCLVLTPTRELAMQVAQAMSQYAGAMGIRALAVYGGQPYGYQIQQLQRGASVVVGTPGRLIDLIDKRILDLSLVTRLVLDEADEMLRMGFIDDIERILSETPASRQTALLSATLPPAIRVLAQRYIRDPESIRIQNTQKTAANIEHRYYLVNEEDKLAALSRLLEVEPVGSSLIFVRTRLRTVELASALVERGFGAEALSGEMSQDARSRVLRRFRDRRLELLVATDVAARGLDVDDVSHVFNYDLPQEPEVYVHRVGRTARAGNTGLAISLLTPMELWQLRRIEGYTKQPISPATLPTEAEIWTQRDARLHEKVAMWLQRGRCSREREMVAELVAEGHDAGEIAAIALKMARAEEKQRPIEPLGELRQKPARRAAPARGARRAEPRPGGKGKIRRAGPNAPGSEFGDQDMVRLILDLGQDQGVEVRDIVRTLARQANIPGSVFGKIRIHEQWTLVDVPEPFLAKVLAQSGAYRIGERQITVTRG
ncbi:MAG: DEAD/DEAH box helicase [Chloroflexi bacterium]|nr:DEAD/DEAH box helicase [Chloroflexota bacterium]